MAGRRSCPAGFRPLRFPLVFRLPRRVRLPPACVPAASASGAVSLGCCGVLQRQTVPCSGPPGGQRLPSSSGSWSPASQVKAGSPGPDTASVPVPVSAAVHSPRGGRLAGSLNGRAGFRACQSPAGQLLCQSARVFRPPSSGPRVRPHRRNRPRWGARPFRRLPRGRRAAARKAAVRAGLCLSRRCSELLRFSEPPHNAHDQHNCNNPEDKIHSRPFSPDGKVAVP